MNLVEEYQVIQWVIAKELLHILKYDGETSLKEWVDERERKVRQLNEAVLNILAFSKPRIIQSVQDAYDEAKGSIDHHIQEEWGFDPEEANMDAALSSTLIFLNENVIRGLYSADGRKGSVEKMFREILDAVRKKEKEDITDVWEVISAIIYEQMKDGFYSGFVQSDGVQWRMDRYINQISKHIYQDTYNRVLQEMLYGKGVELVRVHKFVRPRDACADLQASGIICIVPRNEASAESLQYPNIWDAQHKYTLPGGHHGSDGNCRHVWHSLGSEKDFSQRLYDAMDAGMVSLEIQRMKFNKMIKKIL